jgi:hypothetical protein
MEPDPVVAAARLEDENAAAAILRQPLARMQPAVPAPTTI